MRRKRGNYGGSWKVAYGDFITAMMALFLVLWLSSQDKRIKQAVERAFRNPFSAVNKESTGIIPNKEPSMQHKARGRFESSNLVELEMLRHITDDLAKMLQGPGETQHNVQLEVIPDGLRINVFDHSHKPVFEPGSDVFTPYGAWVFSTLAWEISRYHSFKIELEGHTESSPPSAREASNKWELSTERANAARRELIQSGVSPEQIYKVSGFADTKPMPHVSPTAEVNRRVTVLLKLQEPGFSSQPVQASNGKPS